jgi:hypothetical protein
MEFLVLKLSFTKFGSLFDPVHEYFQLRCSTCHSQNFRVAKLREIYHFPKFWDITCETWWILDWKAVMDYNILLLQHEIFLEAVALTYKNDKRSIWVRCMYSRVNSFTKFNSTYAYVCKLNVRAATQNYFTNV